MTKYTFSEVICLIHKKTLPDTFNNWTLSDKKGWTVAHTAATVGRLPEDFDMWELCDDDGFTVAHTAAVYNNLPPNFSKWELKDIHGTSVKDALNSYDKLMEIPTTFKDHRLKPR